MIQFIVCNLNKILRSEQMTLYIVEKKRPVEIGSTDSFPCSQRMHPPKCLPVFFCCNSLMSSLFSQHNHKRHLLFKFWSNLCGGNLLLEHGKIWNKGKTAPALLKASDFALSALNSLVPPSCLEVTLHLDSVSKEIEYSRSEWLVKWFSWSSVPLSPLLCIYFFNLNNGLVVFSLPFSL